MRKVVYFYLDVFLEADAIGNESVAFLPQVYQLVNTCNSSCGFLTISQVSEDQCPYPQSKSFSSLNSKSVKRSRPRCDTLPQKRPSSATQCFSSSNAATEGTGVKHYRELRDETGAKVYLCDLCQYRSNQSNNMRKHVDLKHKEKCPKYHCSMCSNASYYQRSHLKPHYMKFHGLPESVAITATYDSQQF